MKRNALILIAGASLFAGCAANDMAGSGASSSAAKPAAKPAAPYFEVPGQDGKTYVFGSADSMLEYSRSQKLPALSTHYSKGQPVYVEDAYSDRLVKEYESQHK